MEKIKAFFAGFWVRLISFILLILSIISLAIGGLTEAEITKTVSLVFIAITAVSAIVFFIGAFLHKKANEK